MDNTELARLFYEHMFSEKRRNEHNEVYKRLCQLVFSVVPVSDKLTAEVLSMLARLSEEKQPVNQEAISFVARKFEGEYRARGTMFGSTVRWPVCELDRTPDIELLLEKIALELCVVCSAALQLAVTGSGGELSEKEAHSLRRSIESIAWFSATAFMSEYLKVVYPQEYSEITHSMVISDRA